MKSRADLRRVIDNTYVQLKSFRRPKLPLQKIPLRIDSNRYRVETLSSRLDLERAFRLRYEVFIREGLDKRRAIRLDMDDFDFYSDHLCVFEQSTNKLVGTYRLLLNTYSPRFYSETEFEISEFLNRPGRKLEMGRACIDAEHRNGLVIALLWKGIYQYMKLAEAQYLFGCASFKVSHPEDVRSILPQLAEMNAFADDLQISVLPAFQYHSTQKGVSISEFYEIPSLVRSYLRAGAKLFSEPAYDKAFRCYDFFTVLDIRALESSYHRYGRSQ